MTRTIIAVCTTLLLTACASPDNPEPGKAQPAPVEAPNVAPAPAPPSSGLRIIDSKVGEGDPAQSGDTVSVHYTGWLYENGKRGTKFDSSHDRGQPLPITIGQTPVIKGWTEGLVGMKKGGKRELIIPPDIAYGPNGRPPVIPPNSTLDFEIEMLHILK